MLSIKLSKDLNKDKEQLIALNYLQEELKEGLNELKGELGGLASKEQLNILEGHIKRGVLKGKAKEICYLPGFSGNAGILLICCGEGGDFKLSMLKDLGALIVQNANGLGYIESTIMLRQLKKLEYDKSVFLTLEGGNVEESEIAYSLLAEGIYSGQYTFTINGTKESKSKDNDGEKDSKSLKKIVIKGDSKLKPYLEAGEQIGESANLARDLINKPGNYCTPSYLANEAKKLANKNLEVKVLEEKEIESLGMGSFMSVAKGSKESPRFIIMRYRPDGKVDKSLGKVALVGKGITFDTGGISLKPSGDMHLMKADMSGAASVIGAMRAISKLDIKREVVGLVPTCENMPSAKAIKPGDVATALNGKTIEILNTDAEGRLILADALSYASKEEKASYIIDIATLTGACMVALGEITTGLMTNDYAFAKDFINSCRNSAEKVWPLPLFKEYQEQIKSDIADLANIGGRYGGAITAAAFLENFVDNIPWIHLDIAGTNWAASKSPSYFPKGATAIMISSLVNFLLSKKT